MILRELQGAVDVVHLDCVTKDCFPEEVTFKVKSEYNKESAMHNVGDGNSEENNSEFKFPMAVMDLACLNKRERAHVAGAQETMRREL